MVAGRSPDRCRSDINSVSVMGESYLLVNSGGYDDQVIGGQLTGQEREDYYKGKWNGGRLYLARGQLRIREDF